MKELYEAIADAVCAVISYAIVDSFSNKGDVRTTFVRLGEALEAEFEKDDRL